MKVIKGYPEKIIFITPQGNNISVTGANGSIKLIYTTKEYQVEYFVKETKQEKLVMNK